MLGWTQVQDAEGSWSAVERMRRLYREGKIKLRVYKMIRGPGPDTDTLIARGASLGEFDGRFTVRAIKVSIDGALGCRGAGMIYPYSEDVWRIRLLTTDL